MIVGSWYALGVGANAIEVMHFAGVPIITFVLLTTGETMLIMQTTMDDTINQEYIRTAQAKGLRESRVRDKHAGRNAIITVLTRLVVSLPYLLTGIVIIERSLQWEGTGETLFVALYNRDMPFVMGTLIVIGVISMLSWLILEILALHLDPRSRDRASRAHYFTEKAG